MYAVSKECVIASNKDSAKYLQLTTQQGIRKSFETRNHQTHKNILSHVRKCLADKRHVHAVEGLETWISQL